MKLTIKAEGEYIRRDPSGHENPVTIPDSAMIEIDSVNQDATGSMAVTFLSSVMCGLPIEKELGLIRADIEAMKNRVELEAAEHVRAVAQLESRKNAEAVRANEFECVASEYRDVLNGAAAIMRSFVSFTAGSASKWPRGLRKSVNEFIKSYEIEEEEEPDEAVGA